jgi:predicted O-methyltransferase YrrM
VITTELEPGKVAAAERNLAEAGLDDLVEMRVGDALTTLQDVPEVDLLFLDGWNNLYAAAT